MIDDNLREYLHKLLQVDTISIEQYKKLYVCMGKGEKTLEGTTVTPKAKLVSTFINELDNGKLAVTLSDKTNWYICGGLYKTYTYKVDNLKAVTELFVDIDSHKWGLTLDNAKTLLTSLNIDLFNKQVPVPSYTIYTGRGLQLHWFIEATSNIKYRNVAEESFIDIFTSYFTSNKHKVFDCEIDPCRWAGHLLRIPTTYNKQSHSFSQFILKFSSKKRYSLDEIDKNYFNSTLKNREITANPQKSLQSTKSKAFKKACRLTIIKNNQKVLKDLEKLQDLRSADFNSARELACFYYKQYALLVTDLNSDKALEMTLKFNSRFSNPLSENEVTKKTITADIYLKKNKNKPATRQTIIRDLKITSEELSHFEMIRADKQTQEECNAKRRIKNRDKNGLTTRDKQKLETFKRVQECKNAGLTQTQAKVKLTISKAIISTYWVLTKEDLLATFKTKLEKGRGI